MKRKKYVKPEIIRVRLDHEQAVIAVCTLNYDNGLDGVPNRCLTTGGGGNCKAAISGGGYDNAGWS